MQNNAMSMICLLIKTNKPTHDMTYYN